MSQDDGVYVLVSRGRRTRSGYKKEYRVIHTQAIENIQYAPNYPAGSDKEVLNMENLLSYFGEATVFNDRKIAEGYAVRMVEEYGPTFESLEYGLVWIEEFAHIPFPRQKAQRPGAWQLASASSRRPFETA